MRAWFPPWLAGWFGLMNIIFAFIQNDGDARWYRALFGLAFIAGAFQMSAIEDLSAALDEARQPHANDPEPRG